MKFAEELKKKMEQMVQNRLKENNPAAFDDSVARKTDWVPLKRGGASFRTHKLERPETFRVEFKSSRGILVFGGIFVLAGIGVPAGMLVAALPPLREVIAEPLRYLDFDALMFAIMGLVFISVGLVLMLTMGRPVVFDKQIGWFWKGRKSPESAADPQSFKNACPLSRIHALQIISEYVRGNKSSYYSYELNLVLEDGKRLNVVDHGNLDRLREDARTLASFLGKPLWDAVQT